MPDKPSLLLFFSAFAYPFRGHGIAMLLLGSIFLAILRIPSPPLIGMYVGGAKTLVGAFVLTYTLAFMFKIIIASAEGRRELPDWPAIAGVGANIVWPVPIMIQITLIGFGLPIALLVVAMFLGSWWLLLLLLVPPLLLFGWFYVPIAILNGALGGHEFTRPARMILAAFRVFGSYIVALALLFFIGVVASITEAIAGLLSIPLLSHYLGILVSFYFTIVQMRVLGLIFYTNRDKLKWEVAV